MGKARNNDPKNEEITNETVETEETAEGAKTEETEEKEGTEETEETVEGTEDKNEKVEKMEKQKAEYIIEVKNKSYTGVAANVQFKNGVGITKNELVADYFKVRGAKITKK